MMGGGNQPSVHDTADAVPQVVEQLVGGDSFNARTNPFAGIPGLEHGIGAHGDYGSGNNRPGRQ